MSSGELTLTRPTQAAVIKHGGLGPTVIGVVRRYLNNYFDKFLVKQTSNLHIGKGWKNNYYTKHHPKMQM